MMAAKFSAVAVAKSVAEPSVEPQDAEAPGHQAGVVTKGFLSKRKQPPVGGDLGNFLDTTARGVMDQASALMAREAPEKTPFMHKYEARELLVGLLAQVHSCEGREMSTGIQEMLAGCIGHVEHLLGVNFYESEEISQGEKHLMIAKDLLKQHHIEHMDCLNHLAMIWSTRAEYVKAEGFLQTSQELHDAFLVTADAASVALSSPEQKQYTATLFLLAQVYQHTQQADKSARCCLQTLDRQALSLTPDELCSQANEWVSNAIQLSGYFLSQEELVACASCLAAAEAFLDLIPAARTQGGCVSEEVTANLTWGWGKLHVARLVAAASTRVLALDGLQEVPQEATPVSLPVKFSIDNVDRYMPPDLDKPIDSYPAMCIVVQLVMALLTRVCKAFPLDGACTEHVVAVQDMSRSYKSLVPFAASPNDVSKLHKRRIDLLEPVAQALNPQCFDWLCKELWYEVAEAYREMLDLKIAQLDSGAKNIPKTKLMTLGSGATNAYAKFVDLFKPVPGDQSVKDHSKPQGITEPATRRWYLTARFGLARCLARTPAAEEDLISRKMPLAASLGEYKAIVDLMADPLHAFPKNGPNFDQELKICQEMVELLPAKMERLHTLDTGRSGVS